MRVQCTKSAWLPKRAAVLTAALLSILARVSLPAGAAVPAGMQSVAEPGGGRLLKTSAVHAASPQTLLQAALADAAGAFGSRPDVLSATRSVDGTLTAALFRASNAGKPIAGIIFATFAGNESRIAIAYDDAGRFAASAPQLIARANAAFPQSGVGEASAGPLRPFVAQDGSVCAQVPSAWRVTTAAQGQFSAAGPDGATVDQEMSARLIDPNSSAYRFALRTNPGNPYGTPYGIPMRPDADPAHAYVAFANTVARAQGLANPNITIVRTIPLPAQAGMNATEIVGTGTVKGVRMRFDGIVGVTAPGPIGGWSMTVKMISAPVARFDADLPALAAVYNSYRVDQGVRGAQVAQTQAEDRAGAARGLALMQQTQAHNSATFNASMSHAQSVQDGIDRSTAGFTRYLAGTTVVQDANGANRTVSESFADAVVKNDPQNFRVVPVSEYRKGSEF